MLHFIPDRFVPAPYQGRRRIYWNECASLALLYAFAFAWAWLAVDSPAEGITGTHLLPEWMTQSFTYLRRLTHNPPMCPLCGGTRSVLAICRGDIITAAHYSLFGIYFFLGGLLHLALKLYLLKTGRQPGSKMHKFLRAADSGWLFMGTMLILWLLQMTLHFTGIFRWHTLQ